MKRRGGSAATGVGTAPVVRLLAAGAQFATLCFGHGEEKGNSAVRSGNHGAGHAANRGLATWSGRGDAARLGAAPRPHPASRR